MKKTLPVRPFLTSRVISARASSTSARTSVDICAVASLTSSPIEGSADSAGGAGNGMVVSVRGTPSLRSVFFRSDLLTDGPPELGPIVRFMLPCSPMSDEGTEHCRPVWGSPLVGSDHVRLAPPFQGERPFLLTGVSLCRPRAVGYLGSRPLWWQPARSGRPACTARSHELTTASRSAAGLGSSSTATPCAP